MLFLRIVNTMHKYPSNVPGSFRKPASYGNKRQLTEGSQHFELPPNQGNRSLNVAYIVYQQQLSTSF